MLVQLQHAWTPRATALAGGGAVEGRQPLQERQEPRWMPSDLTSMTTILADIFKHF